MTQETNTVIVEKGKDDGNGVYQEVFVPEKPPVTLDVSSNAVANIHPNLRETEPLLITKDGKITAQIPRELLSKCRLFVATPMYGGVCHGAFAKAMADLTNLAHQYHIPFAFYSLYNESLITRARNYSCDEFMRARIKFSDGSESTFTHLLFIDSDIGFNPMDVLIMLGINASNPKYDVTCAPYSKKCWAFEKVVHAVKIGYADDDPEKLANIVGDYVFNPLNSGPVPLDRPFEILEGGTGFMMIKREAMDKFATELPELAYRPDHVRTKAFDGSRKITAFFDCYIDRGYFIWDLRRLLKKFIGGEVSEEEVKKQTSEWFDNEEKKASLRYLSEDYAFNQLCRKLGMRVWMFPWIRLSHWGTTQFAGSLIDIANIGASMTADAGLLNKIKKQREQGAKPPPPPGGKFPLAPLPGLPSGLKPANSNLNPGPLPGLGAPLPK